MYHFYLYLCCGHHDYDILIKKKKPEVCKYRVGKALYFSINFLKVEIRRESIPVSSGKKKRWKVSEVK